MVRLRELEDWLTAGDVAKELGISRQGAHKMLMDGKLRAARTRLGFLVDPKDVERVRRELSRR